MKTYGFLVLIWGMWLAGCAAPAYGMLPGPRPTTDEVISPLTFCVVDVLELDAPEKGTANLSVRVVQVLHRGAPNPRTWRARLARFVDWFSLHRGSLIKVSASVGFAENILRMTLAKGDRAIIILDNNQHGRRLVEYPLQMMPGREPYCLVTGDRDHHIIALEKVFELYEERDPKRRLERLMGALSWKEMPAVGYAMNSLMEHTDDPNLKEKIGIKIVENLVRIARAQDTSAFRDLASYDCLQKFADDPNRREPIRRELLKVRNISTMPAARRWWADEALFSFSPKDYRWSSDRICFLEEMKKEPDIIREAAEDQLRLAEKLKREHEQPKKP